MQVIRIDLPASIKEQHFLAACDVHFGSVNCDLKHLKKDLKEARKRNARICFIGDIFDAIFPQGDKRHNPTVLVKELRDRDDATVHAVSMLRDLLAEYADLIDMMGMGNHELTVLRYHGVNMVTMLVMELNQILKQKKSKHRIQYGGYTCYLGYGFGSNTTRTAPITILSVLCHHGGGGSAPVTRGMIDVNRKRTNWDYDVFLFGHKHNNFAVRDVTIAPSYRKEGGFLKSMESRAIQAGSYYKNYGNLDGVGIMPSYEEVGAHAPKPLGGTFFRAKLVTDRAFDGEGKRIRNTSHYKFEIRAEV